MYTTQLAKEVALAVVILALLVACEQQPANERHHNDGAAVQTTDVVTSAPPTEAPASAVPAAEVANDAGDFTNVPHGCTAQQAAGNEQETPAVPAAESANDAGDFTNVPHGCTAQQAAGNEEETSVQIDTDVLTNVLAQVTAWVDAWFVNTQMLAYADCTNILLVMPRDQEMRECVQAVLVTNSHYATVAAFLSWSAATDNVARATALEEMQSTVTATTWPFYMYAMYATPRETACAHLMPPGELLARVFVPESLWDVALVQLGLFYRNCDSEDALISYWDEISKRRPALAGAAVVHQIAAAQRMGDGERVIAILRAGLDAVRKEAWAVERAISTLNAVSHPDVSALSNALVAPMQ